MTNNSKQIWMTILIALVVGILSSVITASIVSKNVLLGPTVPPKEINAHSCKADETCETNKVLSEDVKSTLIRGIDVFATNLEITETTKSRNFNGQYFTANYKDQYTSLDYVGVRSSNWVGNSTAYACIQPSGSIFRSDTPCA